MARTGTLGGAVIDLKHFGEQKHRVWSVVHQVFRLVGNGELICIARFDEVLPAERLVETLS